MIEAISGKISVLSMPDASGLRMISTPHSPTTIAVQRGGTKHYAELLKPFGLDATDPSFWDKGLSMIEGLIDELEALDKAE